MKANELIKLGFTKEYVPAEENGSDYGFTYYSYCVDGTALLITDEKDDNICDFDFNVEFFYHQIGKTNSYETIKKLIEIINEFKK